MPYIKSSRREKINPCSLPENNIIDMNFIECAGDLNYAITVIIHDYVRRKGENYQHYNDVIGALEGAKLEVYRRKVSNYEDQKSQENGDV